VATSRGLEGVGSALNTVGGLDMTVTSAFARMPETEALHQLTLGLEWSNGENLQVWRPVQYLGSKLRSLGVIRAGVKELTEPGAHVVDAFSGSTVVSQALAALPRTVTAVDTSAAAALWSRAVLGIGRDDVRSDPTDDLVGALNAIYPTVDRLISERSAPWMRVLDEEDAALASRDGRKLGTLTSRIPQVWRPEGATPAQKRLFAEWHTGAENKELGASGFVTAVYSGTYFGLRQSVELEALIAAAWDAFVDGKINAWQHASVLTIVMHAASAASYSPGKHFAQPHKLRPDKDLTFHRQRLLADRSVRILDRVHSAVQLLASVVQQSSGLTTKHHLHHIVLHKPAEALTAEDLTNASLVYADPPYTAQQYSRFYHVLDVLAEGRPQVLQTQRQRKGMPSGEGASRGVTTGLYPTGRYLSDFCRASLAPIAFERFFENVYSSGATLILSYSQSVSGKTGNARVIDLPTLLASLRRFYGSRIELMSVDLRYRQFNAAASSLDARDDREYLVVAYAA